MTHDEIIEDLSAYFDGQLGPEKTIEISAHVSSCPECRAALDELKALSAGVKTNLAAAAPAGMKERVLARALERKKPQLRTSTVLAAALAVIILALMAALAAKRAMPVMFAQIQGMINGASSTLGASGGNK
ncbi:MAG: zf-HC2 domain-containing protein [Elusimicrobiota bacterium]|nr:zf-HC2 domain-containing protein [Elusimicrobiota bacterium]